MNDRRTGKLFVERQKYCFETDRSLCPGANQNGVIFEKHDVTCANKTCVGESYFIKCKGLLEKRHLLINYFAKLNEFIIVLKESVQLFQ